MAPEICQRLKEMGADGKPVFKSRAGDDADVVSLKHRVRRIVKEAGITGEKLGAHTFRHTSASMIAKATGSALAVKAVLQHDKIDTSMLYIHDAEDSLAQAISPMELLAEEWAEKGNEEPVQALLPEGEFIEVDEDGVSTEIVPVGSESSGIVLEEEMFTEIEDGKEVRPLLKTEDLRMMRRVFIGYAKVSRNADVTRCRELLKRIVRRPKVRV